MATLLSEIPGFGCLQAMASLEVHRKDCARALAEVFPVTLFPDGTLENLLQHPSIKLMGHVEAFPLAARLAACATLIRQSVVYSPEDRMLYVDVSQSLASGFAANFVAELGVCALAGTLIVDRFETIAQDFLQQTHDADAVKIFARNYVRHTLESPQSIPSHGLFYNFVREFGHALLAGKTALPKSLDCLMAEALVLEPGKENSEIHIAHFWAAALHNIIGILTGTLHPAHGIPVLTAEAGTYPLSAVCTITKRKLPALSLLLGPSLAKTAESWHPEFLEQFTWPLISESKQAPTESEDLYARTPGNTQALANSEALSLPDWELCPLADIQVRADRNLDTQEDAPALLMTWACDLATRAADPIGFLPHIHTNLSIRAKILSADVAPTLHWAILELSPEDTEAAQSFPAFFSGWSMQADRLRTNTVYKAHLGFWVTGFSDASGHSGKEPYRPGDNPLVHLRAHKTRHVTFQNRAIGSCIACARFIIEGIEIPIFMTSNRYSRLIKDSHSDCYLQGYFFVERFEADDAALERILQLSRPPVSINNLRALESLSETDGRAALALAQQMPTKTQAQREKQQRLIQRAAKSNLPEALYLDAKSQFENKDRHKEGLFPCILEMTKAAALGYPEAMATLINQPFFKTCVAEDIQDALLQILAKRFQHAPSQYSLAQQLHRNNPEKPASQMLRLTWLMHSFLNGCDAGTYELIEMLSLGIGGPADPGLAEQILRGAALRGCDEAQYWIAGLGRMGSAFFQASQSERLQAFQAGVSEGIPSSVLALALFYEFDGKNLANAALIAHKLYQWVEKTLGNPEIAVLRERIESALTNEDRERLPWFNPWEAIGCTEPTNSLPLEDVTSKTEWRMIFTHPSFIRSLDPSAKENTLSQRLMRQIDFFAENSAVVPLGLVQDPQKEANPHRRLSVYQDGCAIPEMRLLIASMRESASGPWSITSVYPLFTQGTQATITLHGAWACESKAAALLHIRIAGQHRQSDILPAFDPLWPLASAHYRTGRHYAAILYGLVCQMKFNASIFDDMPSHLIEQLQKQLEQIPLQKAQKKMVGFSAYGNEGGLYQLNTTVRAIGTEITLGSLSFLRLEVDPFFVCDGDASTFTLYVDTKQHCPVRPPKVGERIDVILELHAYPVGMADKPNIVLN